MRSSGQSLFVIAGFAGIVNETLDRILLKQILYDPGIPGSLDAAEAQVGIYSACYKLARHWRQIDIHIKLEFDRASVTQASFLWKVFM